MAQAYIASQQEVVVISLFNGADRKRKCRY